MHSNALLCFDPSCAEHSMGRIQTDDGRNFASKKSCMRALRRALPAWPLQRHALLLLSPAPPSFNVGKQMWCGNLRNFFRSNAPPWHPGRRPRMSTLKFGGRGPLPDIVHACQRMMCVLLAKFLPSPVGKKCRFLFKFTVAHEAP